MATTATEDAARIGDAPANKLADVTKSDSTDLTGIANKGIYVGTGGDVVLLAVGDTVARTLKNIQDGTFIKGDFSRVMAATTASDMVAFGRR